MTVKRVIFIRPGETDWNKMGRWQGWVAVPLNEHGRAQSLRLANFIRNIGIRALYTSDLRRAAETAAILEPRLGFAPILDARLRERNIGAWQGLTMAEMQAWYFDEYTNLMESRDEYRVPGGESREDVKVRMLEAFNDILRQDKGETVGVISHTTAIHALLREITPDWYADNLVVSNTSVTTIMRADDDSWKLVTTNDLMHLEGLETATSPELGDNT